MIITSSVHRITGHLFLKDFALPDTQWESLREYVEEIGIINKDFGFYVHTVDISDTLMYIYILGPWFVLFYG